MNIKKARKIIKNFIDDGEISAQVGEALCVALEALALAEKQSHSAQFRRVEMLQEELEACRGANAKLKKEILELRKLAERVENIKGLGELGGEQWMIKVALY